MVDELFDRQYSAGRNELNEALLHFVSGACKAVSETFAVLNRIEYSAPWTSKPHRTRTH